MAKEIQFTVPATGTHYVVVRNAAGQWYNTATPGFEAFNGANWTSYDIAAAQVGTSKVYDADMPAVAAGLYEVFAFLQAGGSPAATDEPVSAGEVEWTGSAVASVGRSLPAAAAGEVAGLPVVSGVPDAGGNWTFNSTLNDASANARHLTGGSPAYGTGILGNALASSSGSTVANFLTGGVVRGRYTISSWVRFNGAGDGTIQVIFAPSDFSVIDFNFFLNSNTDLSPEWLDGAVTLIPSGVTTDAWHHYAVVVDSGYIVEYVDGEVGHTVSGLTQTNTWNVADEIRVSVSPGTDSTFLDDLVVVQEALTAAQVRYIYNAGVGRTWAAAAAAAPGLDYDLVRRVLGDGATILIGTGARSDVRAWNGTAPNNLVTGRVDGRVGAMAADVLTASALATDAGQELADRVLTRNVAGGSDGGRTVREALAATRNKVAFDVPAPGQFTVYAEDDTTPLWTGTYSRGANTLGPLTATDPA